MNDRTTLEHDHIDLDAPTFDRRTFLGVAAGAGALLTATVGACSTHPARTAPRAARRARNMIFMVSDGMSMGTLQLADLQTRLKHERPSHWVQLLGREGVVRSIVDTRSANSHVTDSAAAASAWGIGQLCNNGAIGRTPDGAVPTPILMQAHQSGKATGLVTTTRITHATPAGFAANILDGNRHDEDRIAAQLLERPIDVMLGGGARFIDPLLGGQAKSFHVLRTYSDVLAHDATDTSRRMLGVFARSHMAFELDREETDQPSLAEMSKLAIKRLNQHANGFVMQIEGGRVDHAAHYNDAGGLIADQIAFDETLRAVLDFVENRDDTLLIVTSDHGNANPGLTDYGQAGIDGFAKLMNVRRSLQWVRRRLDQESTASQIQEVILDATGVALTGSEADVIRRWESNERVDPFVLAHNEYGPYGRVLANHFKVAFLSPNHTSDFVELTALGPGSELLPNVVRINDVHPVMVGALDLPPARPI